MLPANLRPFAEKLLKDYQSVGLFPSLSYEEFAGRVAEAVRIIDEEEWQDASQAGKDGQLYFRQLLLGMVHGVRQDHRFTAGDVLAQIGRCLNGSGIELAWGKEAFAERRREIVLRIAGGPQLAWQYRNVAGLVRGVNQLLLTARARERFIELASDGDYHLFVCGTEDIERRIANSPLFRTHHEPDPIARPAAGGLDILRK